jgi:hypothetical protein
MNNYYPSIEEAIAHAVLELSPSSRKESDYKIPQASVILPFLAPM